MNYLISVISPCYNAEKTLIRCIESVIAQSIGFENIELILYDDASTDNTKKIIASYSEKYENIIPIFSDSNQGPGVGKDLCIAKSTGKYMMSIDSDDEYDQKICETLLNEINDDVDIVSCNYDVIEENSSKRVYCKFTNDYKLKNKSLIKYDELMYIPSFFVVNKIFKRDIIIKNKIEFTNIRNGEDELFLRHYLSYSKNLVHLNDYFGYTIYKQKDSISNSQTIEDLFTHLLVCRKIMGVCEHSEVDIPRLLEGRIRLFIELLYTDILISYDKNRLYLALDSFADFEKEISFNRSLGFMDDVTNFFIKHRQFRMLLLYSKILYYSRKSQLLLKIYRHLTQR